MLATLVVWIIKFVRFLPEHLAAHSAAPGAKAAAVTTADYAFFNLLHGTTLADWGGHVAVGAFIVIHHLRMAVGVEFAGRDNSFFRAKLHAPAAARRGREWVESLFLALIVSCSVLLTYYVGATDYLASAILLLAQGILLVLYDLLFWHALLRYDEGNKANQLLVFGDGLFLVTALVLIINRIVRGSTADPAFIPDVANGVLALCWIYFGLFVFEVIFAYWSAISRSFREMGVAVKHLVSRYTWTAR
jgi:hypothetical protein